MAPRPELGQRDKPTAWHGAGWGLGQTWEEACHSRTVGAVKAAIAAGFALKLRRETRLCIGESIGPHCGNRGFHRSYGSHGALHPMTARRPGIQPIVTGCSSAFSWGNRAQSCAMGLRSTGCSRSGASSARGLRTWAVVRISFLGSSRAGLSSHRSL